MQVGSLVVIKNDKQKCLYKIFKMYTKHEETICLLYGVYYRITREELITLIEKNFVLKAGEYFNRTKMDATNYYVKAYDMHKLFEIKDKL